VEGVALEEVAVVVALLYLGRYLMPVVGQLDFDPSNIALQSSAM
jgi:hypothetical protein